NAGWVEGRNLVIEERIWGAHLERMDELAAQLVASSPDVLVTGYSEGVRALLRATDSRPVVWARALDPIGSGLIASYARPGGSVTGTSQTVGGSLGPKLLDLLRQLVPELARVAVVVEVANAPQANDMRAIEAAAHTIRIDVRAVDVSSPDDVE